MVYILEKASLSSVEHYIPNKNFFPKGKDNHPCMQERNEAQNYFVDIVWAEQ